VVCYAPTCGGMKRFHAPSKMAFPGTMCRVDHLARGRSSRVSAR
jgi:hypothetical protein